VLISSYFLVLTGKYEVGYFFWWMIEELGIIGGKFASGKYESVNAAGG
jgi:hypothetical protein